MAGLAEPLRDAVIQFAERCDGAEAERVAVATESGELRELENVHPDPARHLRGSEPEWFEALESAALVLHNHPQQEPLAYTPSVIDQRSQLCQRIPWAIICPDGSSFVLGVRDPARELEGRGFRFGVDDCYGVFRDAWERWAGEELPNFARRWRWWVDGEPLIERGLMHAGFHAVAAEELQRGDAILFRLRGDVFSHIGFYLGAGMMLHHPGPARPYDPSQLSRRESVERWLQLPHQIVRRGASA